MYEGYPLQLTVRLSKDSPGDLGTAYLCDRTKNGSTFSEADFQSLADQIRTSPCSGCGNCAFDTWTVETNRFGLCESCFDADLYVEIESEEAANRMKLAEQDLRMREDGMAYRVSAWIHPGDADDYEVDWYFPTLPTEGRIWQLIRDEGSEVQDDYRIVEL